MRELLVSLEYKNRVPSDRLLATAFREFISARIDAPGVITEFQTRLLVTTWKYLKEKQEELSSNDWQSMFLNERLEEVLFVLSGAKYAQQSHEALQTLARSVFHELCTNCAPEWDSINDQSVVAYVDLLALLGNPAEARDVVETFWWKLRECEPSPWFTVMKGFAMNGDERQLQEVVSKVEGHEKGGILDELTKELIEEDRGLHVVKTMFECGNPSPAAKVAVIKYAIEKGDLDLARPIFDSLLATSHSAAETLKATLLWEAAHGKNATEIGGIVTAWTRENPSTATTTVLDTSMVADLVRVVNAVGRPQEAVQFTELASSKWGVERDTRIRLAQLESAILMGDVLGALDCCWGFSLNFHEVALENLGVMNKLVAMVSLSEEQPGDSLLDQVASLMEPFVDNGAYVEPATAAALTRMLLRRHDVLAVQELLRPLINSYEAEERVPIRQVLIEHIKRQANNDEAWETYQLLRFAFAETSVSERTDVMKNFFGRKQSKRACLVFGHMRQIEGNRSRRPSAETYALCLQGIARWGYFGDLELIHNMLKLDMEVDANTRILNGLMWAYAACDVPEKSMQIFREILQSEEGPTLRTVAIFFKMCEKHHNGTNEAIKMMNKAKLLEIEIDRNTYNAFVASLAAQCEFDAATEAVEYMHSEIGQEPNRDTWVPTLFSCHNTYTDLNMAYRIGCLYNAIPFQYWKERVEEWAMQKYPDLWEELRCVKQVEGYDGMEFEGISPEYQL